MKVLHGIVASPGLAVGKAYTYGEIFKMEELEQCTAKDVQQEVNALRRVQGQVIKELENMLEVMPEEKGFIEAYSLMLESIINEAEELVLEEKLCSIAAIIKVFKKYDQLLASSGSELINLRRSDLKSLVLHLVKYLRSLDVRTFVAEKGTIIVAEELSPMELMELRKADVAGIVTSSGGLTSHVAILARTYGVPYLIVPGYPVNDLVYKTCIIDALSGRLIVEPDKESLKQYEELYVKYNELITIFKQFSKTKAKTLDGLYVKVNCNIGALEDLRLLDEFGCDGVGLFRVEFMYIRRKEPPSEKELVEMFNKILNLTRGKEVIVRAPDIGADKPVEYINFEGENNPQLGLRGIRLLLKYKDELLIPFIKAFIYSNRNGDMKLLFPMITSLEEVTRVLKILEEVSEDLSRKLNTHLKLPSLGIMVETPAAIFIVDDIVRNTPVEFISIGTNDLTQYILAADRTNPKLHYLYNELHPAVLRSIEQLIKTVEKAGKPVDIEVCGEMASQTRAIPILLALGIRKLSVVPVQVGKVKYYINNTDISKIKDTIFKTIHDSTSHHEVEEAIKKLFEEYRIRYFP